MQPPPGRHLISAGIIQAVGIFALSCSAHTTLPALRRCGGVRAGWGNAADARRAHLCAAHRERATAKALLICCSVPHPRHVCSVMRKPAQFPAALAVSFSVMLACYASLAAAGYWYWGDSASPLVTTGGWVGGGRVGGQRQGACMEQGRIRPRHVRLPPLDASVLHIGRLTSSLLVHSLPADLAINSYYSARRMPIDRALVGAAGTAAALPAGIDGAGWLGWGERWPFLRARGQPLGAHAQGARKRLRACLPPPPAGCLCSDQLFNEIPGA